MINGLEELLLKRWILKAQNKEKYYQIKDNSEAIRKYVTEKLGCQLIINPYMVKLEKIPAQAKPYMGIMNFTSQAEYAFLCIILMFLEDKEAQEQFVLSQLTEYVSVHFPGDTIDWTVYTTRRQLIKVMQFCIENNIILVTDGDADGFAMNQSAEVLYENTGVSRYFMRIFVHDIQNYSRIGDFEQSDWLDLNEDRGMARRHRVYKRLLFSPGIYRNSEEDEDFNYLKYYGSRLEDDLETNLNCRLQIYKNSAYLIMNPDCNLAKAFPENNSLSDFVLLFNHYLTDRIKQGKLKPDVNEILKMDAVGFERELLTCRSLYVKGMVKTYRDKTSSDFYETMRTYMESTGFIQYDSNLQQIQIYPIIGKITGTYPADFERKEIDS